MTNQPHVFGSVVAYHDGNAWQNKGVHLVETKQRPTPNNLHLPVGCTS
jgi:hypothetical protein